MELSQVAKLKEVHNAGSAEEHIAEGWKLIAVIPTSRPDGLTYPTYILGKGLTSSERLAKAGL